MSSAVLNGATCASINQELTAISNGAAGEGKRTKVGFINSLKSPINTMNTSMLMIDKGNGKRGSVLVQYAPRQVQGAVTQTLSNTCDSTQEPALLETEYDITLQSEYKFTIDEDYVALICEGQSSWINRHLNASFDALARDVNSQLIAAAAAGFGINPAQGDALVRATQILDATNDDAILNGNWLDFRDSDIDDFNIFHDNPIIVGQGVFSKFNLLNKMACCNDRGQDVMELTAQAGYSFFKDQMMNSELGTNECIVFEPGSLHLLTYNKYANRVASGIANNPGAYFAYDVADGEARGVIRDPITGLTYDIKIVKQCDDKYTFILSLNYDLFIQPSDMYLGTDPLDGANGLLYYRFTDS